jgi:hypothetical protein
MTMAVAARHRAWPGRPRVGPILFLLPALVPIAVFSVLPLLEGIYLGFTDARAGINVDLTPTFLDNYIRLLSDDLFWSSFQIGAIWAVSTTALQYTLGLVLALLLEQRDEDGNPPSDRHLRDELVALLVGGHDSSAAALAWAFERLAWHPAVQERLREGDPAYLDAVVKEALRIRPALTIAPRLLREPVQIAGHTVPAGVQVAACIWLACRREDLWAGANEFRPERWLDSSAAPNPLSWIPFGGGVRRCAGAPFAEMEMREVLRAATGLRLRPARPEAERARRSMLVLVPHRGAEVLVE